MLPPVDSSPCQVSPPDPLVSSDKKFTFLAVGEMIASDVDLMNGTDTIIIASSEHQGIVAPIVTIDYVLTSMLDQQDTIPTLKTLSNFDISNTQDDDNVADSAYYDSSADPKEIPPDPPNDDFLLMMALRKFPLLESAVYSKLEIFDVGRVTGEKH